MMPLGGNGYLETVLLFFFRGWNLPYKSFKFAYKSIILPWHLVNFKKLFHVLASAGTRKTLSISSNTFWGGFHFLLTSLILRMDNTEFTSIISLHILVSSGAVTPLDTLLNNVFLIYCRHESKVLYLLPQKYSSSAFCLFWPFWAFHFVNLNFLWSFVSVTKCKSAVVCMQPGNLRVIAIYQHTHMNRKKISFWFEI